MLRKSLAHGVGRSPTRQLRLALKRASILVARSEAAGLDPNATPAAITNLDRAARMALADLAKLKASHKPQRLKSMPSMAALMERANGG